MRRLFTSQMKSRSYYVLSPHIWEAFRNYLRGQCSSSESLRQSDLPSQRSGLDLHWGTSAQWRNSGQRGSGMNLRISRCETRPYGRRFWQESDFTSGERSAGIVIPFCSEKSWLTPSCFMGTLSGNLFNRKNSRFDIEKVASLDHSLSGYRLENIP